MVERRTDTPESSERPGGDAGPTVASVNVGAVRTVEWRGQPVTTGIWKEPVGGPVPVRGVNLAGDDQADRSVHGGPDKAVYADAQEDTAWWATQLGRSLAPGTFGENLTTSELDVTNAVVGEQWEIGSAVLEVSQPRVPCDKLGVRMGDERFPAPVRRGRSPGRLPARRTRGRSRGRRRDPGPVAAGPPGDGRAGRARRSPTTRSGRGSSTPRSWPSRGPTWPATRLRARANRGRRPGD
jgi:hypothetical protein